jgi:hypothetical protein
MATSAQIRQKIAQLARQRADVEKKISEAEARRSKKESEAAAREASASRASSDSSKRSYLRQAESARRAALAESNKIADLSKRLAAISRDEGSQHKSLVAAEKSEASAAKRAADKARREREQSEKRLAEQRRSEERRRQEERMTDERRRRQDRATTATLISETEMRLTKQIEAIRSPRKEQLRVLYATASSQGDLRVDEEIRRVRSAVRASTHRDQVVIEHLSAATPGDLLDGLTSFRPHVVHFSGHADEGVLVFDDGSDVHGDGHHISVRAFKSAVEAPDEPPLLVVLNACRSAQHLDQLLGRVALAVGMSDNIGDVDALTFATRFYRTLAEGQSVWAALATARADMEMNGLPDHDLPILAALDGIDPTTVCLVIAD